VLVRTVIDREFQVTVGGMGPTELRIGILLLNLIVLSFEHHRFPACRQACIWRI
jgi:hypothetical protein